MQDELRAVMSDLLLEADQEAENLLFEMVKKYPGSVKLIKDLKVASPWTKILMPHGIWRRHSWMGPSINHEIYREPTHHKYQARITYGGTKIKTFKEFDTLEEAKNHLDQIYIQEGWILTN